MKDCVKTGNKSVAGTSGVMKWVSRIVILAGVCAIAYLAVVQYQNRTTTAGSGAVVVSASAPAAPASPLMKWTAIELAGWGKWSKKYADIPQYQGPDSYFRFFIPDKGAKVEWADRSITKIVPGKEQDFSGHFGKVRFRGPEKHGVYVCIGPGCRQATEVPQEKLLPADREPEEPPDDSGGAREEEGEQKMASEDSCDDSSCTSRR